MFANRSITSGDAAYGRYLSKIGAIINERDEIAGKIKAAVEGAAFANQPVSEHAEDGLGARARRLIDRGEDLAERDERFGD